MYNVVVNDIDTAMEVLVKKGADFASRMRTPSCMYHLYRSFVARNPYLIVATR